MAASIVQLRVGNVTTAVPFQINRELLSATSPFHVTTLTADDSRVAMCVNDCIILTGSGEVPRAVLPNPPDALNFHVAFSDGSHFTRLQIELDSAGHTIGIPRDLQSAAPDIENLSTFRHAMEAARDCIALAHWPVSCSYFRAFEMVLTWSI